eukprot:Tbor_TRINITY_DN5248_c0_g3::TRINITY_DN5248_c0_g3_i1::g.16586::m.16586
MKKNYYENEMKELKRLRILMKFSDLKKDSDKLVEMCVYAGKLEEELFLIKNNNINNNNYLINNNNNYINDGFYIIGCDEAGRGPLAGPVSAAAVCSYIPGNIINNYINNYLNNIIDVDKSELSPN